MSDPRLTLLGEQLKNARESNGVSQSKAGQAIYRSDRKIRFIESGEQMPDLLEFLQLMEIYQRDPAQFLLDVQERYRSEYQVEHGFEQSVLAS